MRTTVTLPDDLHRRAQAIAHDTSRTLSETLTELLRRALDEGAVPAVSHSLHTGFPLVPIGKIITTVDVRSLDDDQ
jgi:hypothetical protein